MPPASMKPARRALRIGLWILLVLVALPLAGVLLVIAVNRFDEPLTPQAQALLQAQPVPGDPSRNAYFVLLGLRAARGEDAMAQGRRIEDTVFRHFADAAAPALPEETLARGTAGIGKEWNGKLRCNVFEKDCVAQHLALRAELPAFEQEFGFLIARYRQVAELPDFRERAFLGLNEAMSSYSEYLDLDAYAQARIAVLAAEGQQAQALQEIGAAVANARKVLAGTRHFIAKAIFVKVLRDHLALLNALMARDPSFAGPPGQPLPAWLAPLTVEERSLAGALDSEARLFARTAHSFDTSTGFATMRDGLPQASLAGWLSGLAFKRNATVNLIAGSAAPGTPALPPSRQWPAGSFWDDYIDNPTGKILLAIASPDFSEYPNRVADADGYLRLTALHWMIRQQGVDDAQVPAFLEAQAARYGDPYQARPMQWDATARTLSFVGKGRAPTSQNVQGYRFVVQLGGRG